MRDKYNSRLAELRDYMEYTQKEVAQKLNIKRERYQNWERGVAMIPLDMADKISLLYKVRLSYILGIDKQLETYNNIKPINYEHFLNNINNLKKEKSQSFEQIATYLNCNRSTVKRYFNKEIIIPIDMLALLGELYNVDLDKILGKQ